jgi:hypothetical protein
MRLSKILSEIDRQIERLKQARTLLHDGDRRATGKAVAEVLDTPVKKKRNLSPEGRNRIAEAVKRRWAKQKKAAAAK